MSFNTWFHVIAKKHLQANAPSPQRTKMPLRLSQDSAVTFSITPLILAETAGALFKSDVPTDHTVTVVGTLSLFGLDLRRAYLSQGEGAFIQFAIKNHTTTETRLYWPYAEQVPATAEDWGFWLADDDGYIGAPVMESKISDGQIPYQRSWGSGDLRISPQYVVESLVDASGATTTIRHRMMHYTRVLTDPKLVEHLLVSAVETDDGASVNYWLGLDITTSDLTVYPTADAPR